ncbi:hypothetical protein JVU11DRAFT_1533 [Chiua virens]|nr:hypothetical protein JVU11DRAFT_1533 [Chiua virens]
MVDVMFISRARHFVPLSLLRHLADIPSATPPEAISYVRQDGINAIKVMPLINRGRLSVQRVSAVCWDVMQTMADKGGWESMSFERKVAKTRPVDETGSATSRRRTKRSAESNADGAKGGVGRKRRLSASTSLKDEGQDLAPRRKSLRKKR